MQQATTSLPAGWHYIVPTTSPTFGIKYAYAYPDGGWASLTRFGVQFDAPTEQEVVENATGRIHSEGISAIWRYDGKEWGVWNRQIDWFYPAIKAQSTEFPVDKSVLALSGNTLRAVQRCLEMFEGDGMPRNKEAYDYIPVHIPIPKLYASEHVEDPTVWIKLFDPTGSWTWYLTEYDPEQDLAFGLVDGFEAELGYISLAEIRQMRVRMGLKIERDLWFNPQPLSKVREKVGR